VIVGDRVAVFPAPGALREYIEVPAAHAVVVPETVPDTHASLMLINTITTREILRAANVPDRPAGSYPQIISAPASSVGRLLIWITHERGHKVIPVVRSTRVANTVRQHFPDLARCQAVWSHAACFCGC